jgi:signal transduction histidine kinase
MANSSRSFGLQNAGTKDAASPARSGEAAPPRTAIFEKQAVLNESLLQGPIGQTIRKAPPPWRTLWHSSGHTDDSGEEDRKALIAVQWLVAIATSYLIFAIQDGNVTEPLPALLILLCLLSAFVVQRIPEKLFDRRVIKPGLLAVDSILIVSAITLPQQTPWDLLLLFFFCVFIAATGENLIHIGAGCVLLSLAFVAFVSPHAKDMSFLEPNFLFRVPFMFGISVVYGHLASQIKLEKRRAEKIQETMKLKRQWVCALAHDIKTPLNVILGHAEMLAGEYGGQISPKEKQSSIACIRKNIEGIIKLIAEFLDVSKLEVGTLNSAKSSVEMNAVVEDVVLQQAVIAREKNLNLTLDLDKTLKPALGDGDQLRRALWNLVSNAIKFTPQGGRIMVSTRMNKKNISVKVADTGAGIPREELSGLFTEYRRLKGAANTEGSGLGLFIVKTIVEAHDGTVTVESEEGVGTTFTVVLPSCENSRARVDSAAAQRTETASKRSARKRRMTEDQAAIQ